MRPLDALDRAPRLARVGVAILAIGATLLATPTAYTAWVEMPLLVATTSFDMVPVEGKEADRLARHRNVTRYEDLDERERRQFRQAMDEEGAHVCGSIPDELSHVAYNGSTYTVNTFEQGESLTPPECDAPLENRVYDHIDALEIPGLVLMLVGGFGIALGLLSPRYERF